MADAYKLTRARIKLASASVNEYVAALVGDMVRKVDLNVRRAIPPGLYYDLEQMRRAMRDIARRGDINYPAHDPLVLEPDETKRRAALSPGKPRP